MTTFISLSVLLLLLQQPTCTEQLCFGSGIPEDTIDVDFQTRQLPEDKEHQWELMANVTWQRPIAKTSTEFDGYAVRAVISEGTRPLDFANCTLDGLKETKVESYVFEGLRYGYTYFFGVSLIGTTSHQRSSKEIWITQASPDCYLETGDVDFCRTQSVEVLGVAVDFHVDCVVPALSENTENDQYTAVLSWTPPIQVNGNITIYELRYGESSLLTKFFDSAPAIEADEETLVYIEEIPGLQADSNYTATVRAFADDKRGPQTFLHFNTYDEQLNNYTHRNDICEKFGQRMESTTAIAATPAPRAPSIVVVVLSSVFAVIIVSGALILYANKRRKSLADSKEAIFVRYPEDEACRKEASGVSDKTLDGLREPDVNFQAKEVDRSLLTINEKLGNGQFGIVYSGVLSPRDSTSKKYAPRPVAVKSLRLNATREMKEDFLDEIKLIIDIGSHPNILPILGCCTVDEPYYLITEFMKYGDLLHFLWQCRDEKCQAQDPIYSLTETGQLQMARQIARGMEYLSNTRYYHGDLAARNVLVGEGLVVKISDFGMADDIYQRGYKRLGQEKKRPLKWVSLETNTKGTCSIKSDVWSFGIVLYEIYTLGDVPYPGMDGFEVVRKLEDGHRMEQPNSCPDEMYIIMLECWHEKPDLRPTFTDLFNKLDRLLSEMSSEYFTELDFDDRLSMNTESTTMYGCENSLGGSRPLSGASDVDSAHYDSLQVADRKPIPHVTVECVDSVQQIEKDTSKC